MNILIIGNGFDLAHGLPTRYIDFMNFITIYKKLYDTDVESIKNDRLFLCLHSDIKKYLISDEVCNIGKHSKVLYEFDRLIKMNIWIEYFVDRGNFEDKGWIDFEYEIAKIIKSLEYYKKYNILKSKNANDTMLEDRITYNVAVDFMERIEKYNKSFYDIKFDEEDAWYVDNKIINILIIELNNLIRCLEIYLEEFVGRINIENKLSDIEEIYLLDKLISFNYTDIFKKVYDKQSTVESDYIHGSLNTSNEITENNMVLGIDEYLDENEKDEELDFIQFKKYFQRIYKKTGCKYKYWVEEMKENKISVMKHNDTVFKNNIYIYGHSLDVTDKDILEELINIPGTQTTIFYYDKNDYAQKVTNMVKIIGQVKLIDMVYGKNPVIIFKEIQK